MLTRLITKSLSFKLGGYGHILSPAIGFEKRNFHASPILNSIDEFIEIKKPNEFIATGRAWTACDLRKKSFEDLHKLWYVLYKERNLLLSEKQKTRRAQRPYTQLEENRYNNVKRSMAAIKFVIDERKKIVKIISSKESVEVSK
jgi:large subunit ribosomal protein L47